METGRALINRIESKLSGSLASESRESISFESRIIAEEITGDSYTELCLNSYELNPKQELQLSQIFQERLSGRPLAYVLNSTTFRDLDLFVDERVLIPRSETELVTQHAIDILKNDGCDKPVVLDIGTGSGAIALSIAHEVRDSKVIGGDISSDAITVAKLNGIATGSAAARVEFIISDLFESFPSALKGKVDLVVSNPPYIGRDEAELVDESVIDNEPHDALFSGETGVDHYVAIISEAKEWLKQNGSLVLEISPRHVEFMEEEKVANGYSMLNIYKDLVDRERIAIFEK